MSDCTFFNTSRFKKLLQVKTVKVISGAYKGKVYIIQKINKKGKLILKDVLGLSSTKKSYKKVIDASNVKIEN
jgi:hypothetical protein